MRRSRACGVRALALRAGMALAGLGLAAGGGAQTLLPGERPSEERRPLGPPELPEPAAPILPPYPIAPPEEPPNTGGIATGARVWVREVVVTGNTAVSSEDLAEVAAGFEDRPLSWSDLQQLRRALTAVYVERGYVTSGARLPEQLIRDGVVRYEIVEGGLGDVVIETPGRLRPGYIERRLRLGIERPLDVGQLEERLQRLQLDPNVLRVSARLEPSDAPGLSRLRVSVREAPNVTAGAAFDNYRSPSIGSLGGTASLRFDDLSGWGDSLAVSFTGSDGLRQVEVQAGVPVTPADTLLLGRYRGSFGEIVDDDFDFLDIESESETFGIELHQPFVRRATARLEGQLRFERRHTETTLGLLDVGLPSDASDDGETDSTVLRFGLEGSLRSRRQALVLRSLLSWGIDAFGITRGPSDRPDARFVAWLAQAQYAARLPWLGIQLLARADLQLADDPLLSNEQIALGGRYTVRGYRENALIRDQGVIGSLELRVPLFALPDSDVALDVVPFFDIGRGWNREEDQRDYETLSSVGVGLAARITRRARAELFWGHALRSEPERGARDEGLQDDGIHFQLRLDLP